MISDSGNGSLFRNRGGKLVLASASPRREELLRSVGLEIEVVPSGIRETLDSGRSPAMQAKSWARQKAHAVSELRPGDWVLGADTIVVLGPVVLGKPEDSKDAAGMLRRLSDAVHTVITGMCLTCRDRGFLRVGHVRTGVRFKQLSEEEIQSYVATGEPLDKAGAYGIQGKGAGFVRSIRGSYTNVVGLPLCEALEWLLDRDVIVPSRTGLQDG